MGEKNYLLAKILSNMTFDPINIQTFWSSFHFRCECVREKCKTTATLSESKFIHAEAKWGDLFKLQVGFVKGQRSGGHEITEQPTCFQRHRSSVTWSSFQRRCVPAGWKQDWRNCLLPDIGLEKACRLKQKKKNVCWIGSARKKAEEKKYPRGT